MYRKCSTEISVQNQRKVTAGLLELMRETPYEDITVSSLCQCAGITRRIFYHLFSNKTDALYALIDNVILGIEGYRPDVRDETEAIELILEAISRAGYAPGSDIALALDVAASEWKDKRGYTMPKSGRSFTAGELTAHWKSLIDRYPIRSIEDPLGEEDWPAWQALTAQLGSQCQLVGDDLFVTNESRLKKGIDMGCGNAILLKPNQIGTLSETIRACQTAQQKGFKTIVSHRSGETEDTTIADLSVALGSGQIKTGAPCRSERVAKYNRLLRIEDALGSSAVFGAMHT